MPHDCMFQHIPVAAQMLDAFLPRYMDVFEATGAWLHICMRLFPMAEVVPFWTVIP